jgi:mRNA interferase YafQ
MRIVKYAGRFKRDYRREKSGPLGTKLDVLLMEAVDLLAADTPLPHRYFDHPLSGGSTWGGWRVEGDGIIDGCNDVRAE